MKKQFFFIGQLISFLFCFALARDSHAAIFTTDTSIGIDNTNFEGLEIVVTNATLTVDGNHAFASIQLLNGGRLTHSIATGLFLTVSNNVEVEIGGSIDASGRGFGGGQGPGAGQSSYPPYTSSFQVGGGGGHGGNGGPSFYDSGTAGPANGSLTGPAELGSGGGLGLDLGGAGGGAIDLQVGVARVDGSISADGAAGVNLYSGGGSGGGIRISAQTFSGTGSISANGGAGESPDGGGGGGGRIAIYYQSNSFSGLLSAHGGASATDGGAGTIYLSGQNANLVLIENAGMRGALTPLMTSNTFDLKLSRGAVVLLQTTNEAISSLIVGSNSWLTTGSTFPLALTVSGDANIENGGSINADGAGYAAGQGPGAGHSATVIGGVTGGGAGYGGYGGANAAKSGGGSVYGSAIQPTDFGSGGSIGSGTVPYSSGGAGGGAISVTVNGTLTLDGQISANGMTGPGQGSGGGSGGSVWLTSGNFQGIGSISANGGAGEMPLGAGGGGGRIAVYAVTNNFNGTLSAHGGPGTNNGSAGTIYSRVLSNDYGQLIIDNGGLNATNSTFTLQSQFDLTIRGNAKVNYTSVSALRLHDLIIRSNSWLQLHNPNNGSVLLYVTNNASVEKGGSILLNGQGFAPNQGPGPGRALTGSGGGHGGYGGNGATNTGGGNSYDLLTTPVTPGSGGGTIVNSQLAGSGGGALQMTVVRALSVEGTISADGGSALAPGCGGGSGGAIWLTAAQLSGSGTISANGGSGGLPSGGGGGGGRIAINSPTNLFSGTISAYGGNGTNVGGAGTIYFYPIVYPNRSTLGSLVIDNGGQRGTNTPLFQFQGSLGRMVVTNGARLIAASLRSVGSLFIATNSTMISTNALSLVASSVVVQAGGALLLDGVGYQQNQGPGAGHFLASQAGSSGSGAGHGGYGGIGAYGAMAGAEYGNFNEPAEPGSGGGGGENNVGGAGGGRLQLEVPGGELLVDGIISANGSPGSGTGGGGSGGSIWIIARRLSGSGIISANGSSSPASGGGGGGGRIFASVITNNFFGMFSVKGGTGANNGGAGTIYLPQNDNPGELIIDNSGLRGANTLLFGQFGPINLTVTGGATASVPGPISFVNLLITSNSTLIYSNINKASLNVSGNVVIQTGAALSVDGLGSKQGPGQAFDSGGAGYGGYGGSSTQQGAGGNSYGFVSKPIDFGSGTGLALGGGHLQMNVAGDLTVDGNLTANGQAAFLGNGGASGGSLWLAARSLLGTGTISANGGAGNPFAGGGGGGGRIAIYYKSNSFAGNITAYGGAGLNYGGAGTIYFSNTARGFPELIVDNGGHQGTNTTISDSGYDLTVTGGAIASTLISPAIISLSVRNLLLISNSWITFPSSQPLVLSVTGDAIVQTGSGFTMDGKGNPAGRGSGYGGLANTPPYGMTGGGGGYGGYGGNSIGNAAGGGSYGSILQPFDSGSGGGSTGSIGGAGGGAMKVSVAGTLALDGTLSANGADASYEGGGGGSGGSIWLTAGSLSGAGLISANGGSGDFLQGGGGGGGRIAIYSASNQFGGSMTAFGGAGAVYGGAGTIYSRDPGQDVGIVRIDNGGIQGTNTALSSPEAFSVNITGAAVVNPSDSPLVLNGLIVDSGGSMTHLNSQSNLDILVLGNAIIETNGFIIVDAKGYDGSDGGPGAGVATNFLGSGGGYGGAGGASASGAQGGIRYGSASQPTDRGGRGGLTPVLAGFSQGGGAVRLQVSSNLTVNGWISANGNSAELDGGGGGAGGSVWLTARQIDGSGLITANGGQGEESGGGGGGGGRIAINSISNKFTGQTYAVGGPGANYGQNGTIVLTNIPSPQIISQTPSGLVYSVVTNVDLTFNSPINFTTVAVSDFTIDTPNGLIPQSSLLFSSIGLANLRLGFPSQNAIGYYELQAGPQIEDIYGQQMSNAYVGSFVILPPSISGHLVDSTGSPAGFVTLHPSGLPPEVADSQGNYSIEVPFGWSGTITPARGTALFIPASRAYTNISGNLPNQNFILTTAASLTLSTEKQGPNLNLTWYGINGVAYQILSSTDLITWTAFGPVWTGSNAPLNVLLLPTTSPATFFKFQISY